MDDEELYDHYYACWKRGYWEIPNNIDLNGFDFDWRPYQYNKPTIHIFGTQWQRSGGPKFVIPEHDGYEFQTHQKVISLPNKNNFIIPDNLNGDFDYSWHHDEFDQPCHFAWKNGVIYNHPTATETIYLTDLNNVDKFIVGKHVTKNIDDIVHKVNYNFWALSEHVDYSKFIFLWQPKTVAELSLVNLFYDKNHINTRTMFVNTEMYKRGYKSVNKIDNVSMNVNMISQLFFIDHGNKESTSNYEQLLAKNKHITKIRYFDNWIDTVNRCVKKATSPFIWIVNSFYNYQDFDFNFFPPHWDEKYLHVFGTQWNEWGKTFLINCEEWKQYYLKHELLEQVGSVKIIDQKAKIVSSKYDILLINFGNEFDFKLDHKIIPFKGSYLKTIDNWVEKNSSIVYKKEYWVWLCSSICDYSNFDFTFEPSPFEDKQLIVFPSFFANAINKFGDTFLLNVSEYVKTRKYFDSLEQYHSKIKFIEHITVSRLQHPIFTHDNDTHEDVVKELSNLKFPYIQVSNNNVDHQECLQLWNNIPIKTNKDATSIYMPMIAINKIKNSLYDYPFIERPLVYSGAPLDIIFISNGEPKAEEHFNHLEKVLDKNKAKNRLVRVDGINGRVAAYHAAASASQTSWFFAVFAKLRVNPTFDWNWQPDRLQQPKHYIFTAINPINRLNYGHQAMIAYNKRITLANAGVGLDFTLDNEHEVVNINSGIAVYNTDPWTTWRTAFREAVKLQDLVSKGTDINAVKRLSRWCGVGIGDYAEYSQRGANDGVAYYNEVNGDLNQLKLSYEWSWLYQRFSNL